MRERVSGSRIVNQTVVVPNDKVGMIEPRFTSVERIHVRRKYGADALVSRVVRMVRTLRVQEHPCGHGISGWSAKDLGLRLKAPVRKRTRIAVDRNLRKTQTQHRAHNPRGIKIRNMWELSGVHRHHITVGATDQPLLDIG
jgi:hypothetical protein